MCIHNSIEDLNETMSKQDHGVVEWTHNKQSVRQQEKNEKGGAKEPGGKQIRKNAERESPRSIVAAVRRR